MNENGAAFAAPPFARIVACGLLRALVLVLAFTLAIALISAFALHILAVAPLWILAGLCFARFVLRCLLIVRHWVKLHYCPPLLRQQTQAPSVPAKSQ